MTIYIEDWLYLRGRTDPCVEITADESNELSDFVRHVYEVFKENREEMQIETRYADTMEWRLDSITWAVVVTPAFASLATANGAVLTGVDDLEEVFKSRIPRFDQPLPKGQIS